MKKQKLLRFILLLVVIIFIIAYLIARKTSYPDEELVPQPTPVPTPPPISKLNLTPIPEGPDTTTFNLKNTQGLAAEPPATISTYTTNLKANQTDAVSIASSFGFTGQPQITPGSNITIYTWRNDQSILTIQDLPFSVSYQNFGQTTTSAADAVKADRFAQQFLNDHQLINPGVSFALKSVGYYRTNGYNILPTRSQSSAQLTQVSYQYSLNELPVKLSPQAPHDIELYVDAQGRIVDAFITILPQIFPSNNVSLIPPATAAVALQNQQGILLNSEINQITEKTPKLIFSKTNILNYELTYLYNQNGHLVPAYLFYGNATNDVNPSIKYSLVYAVPAIYQ